MIMSVTKHAAGEKQADGSRAPISNDGLTSPDTHTANTRSRQTSTICIFSKLLSCTQDIHVRSYNHDSNYFHFFEHLMTLKYFFKLCMNVVTDRELTFLAPGIDGLRLATVGEGTGGGANLGGAGTLLPWRSIISAPSFISAV